jgi:drug/metabolite transporter (DMT)-like permease
VRVQARSSPRSNGSRDQAIGQQLLAPAGLVWGALAVVYVIWGSTYLAIREAILTIPPLLMASVRFLIAGGILYAVAVRRGDRAGDRPTRAQWWTTFVIGVLLLAGGNGAVTLAERTVPTGVAALVIATVPVWMALIDRVFFGQRLAWQAVVGLALGFAGLALLVGGPGGGHLDPRGMVIVLIAPLSWAAGSMYSRTAHLPARPLVGTAMQMLGGGAALAVAAAIHGEFAQIHLGEVSLRSALGLAYLIVFGSWGGFVAYAWLLRVAPVSLIGTYAYVNPVVAVFLGWLILHEAVAGRTLLAAAVIVVAVALIVSARRLPPGEPAGPIESEPSERSASS